MLFTFYLYRVYLVIIIFFKLDRFFQDPLGSLLKLGLWLRLECSLDCIIYVSEGFDVPRDYRSRRGRETIKRYDVTETYSHVVRQNLSETSITCAESC